MALALPFRLALAALLFAGATWPARALQLGESKAQIFQRHGEAGAEDRGKNVAIYFWAGWSAELEFKEDTVQKLIYRRDAYLQAAEVAALLQSNGGLARWRETTPAKEPMRQWVRDDGAVASCLAMRPLMMTFEGAKERILTASPSTHAAPRVVVPAQPRPISATPPAFPKLLVVEPDSELPQATPAAALSALSPRPMLRAEDVATAPVSLLTNPAPKPESLPAPETPAALPVLANEHTGNGAVPLAEKQASPGGPALALGLFAVFGAAIGGGLYFFKSRARWNGRHEMKARVAAPRWTAKASMPVVAMQALDALRNDQFELLVGEIFRREGYTVELSAAMAQGDSIDLTLRRDAETILVQCKHWKAVQVTDREVREFYGAMMANGAPRGIFVTMGTFSRDAYEFAEGKQIDLMDRAALEESTAAVARPGEKFCEIKEWVEEFTAHARVFDPECPICQGTMVIRHHRATGVASWSCRSHPRCPGRREARLDLLAAA
jgi:hypothetical protein